MILNNIQVATGAAWRRAAVVGLSGALVSGVGLAQVQLPPTIDPGVIQQQSEQQRQRMERELQPPQEMQPAPVDATGLQKPADGAVPPIHFVLKRVEFSPSEILDKEALAAIAAEFEGRDVTFAELRALVAKVNALYRVKGAVAAEAVIPPQDVSSGVVKIRLVEGRVGSYRIDGNAATREDYVTARMRLPAGALFDTRQLEQDMIRFNRSNDAQLRAELKAGEAFGTTDIVIHMQEPQRHSLRLFADNAGSKSTGENRAGVTYENRSLLGYRDALSLYYTGAEGYAGQGINYSFPFNTWGGRLQIGYQDDKTKIISGFFAPLKVTGAATAWSAKARQPIYLDAAQQLDATLGMNSRTSKTFISNTLLQRVDSIDTSFGAEYQLADRTGAWLSNINYITGHADPMDASRLEYSLWRAYVRRDQELTSGFSGRFVLSGQGTNRHILPSTAQYFIGGVGSVRGYSTAAYSGNSGYTANLELRHALYGSAPGGESAPKSVTGLLFYDYAEARPSGAGLTPVRLASVGFGAELAIGNRAFGHLTFAYQLHDQPNEPRGYRVDFSIISETF